MCDLFGYCTRPQKRNKKKIRKCDISRPIPFVGDLSKIEKFRIPSPIKLVREKYKEAVINHYGGEVVVLTCPKLPGGINHPDVKDFITGPIRIEKSFRGVPCCDPRDHLQEPSLQESRIDIPSDLNNNLELGDGDTPQEAENQPITNSEDSSERQSLNIHGENNPDITTKSSKNNLRLQKMLDHVDRQEKKFNKSVDKHGRPRLRYT